MSNSLARHAAVLAVGVAMLTAAAPVRADHAPVLVVPSRPGFPVVINGRNAAWSVVEGDWGLSRPGHMPVTIIGGGEPLPRRNSYHRHPYHPRYGTMPQRGRYEVEPAADRLLPEPAENYSRVWSTSSDPVPADGPPPRQRSQSYNADPESLPPNVSDAQQPFTPPIVVVPHGRRRP